MLLLIANKAIMRRLSVMLKRPLRLIPSIVRLIAAWGKFFFS